jgi:hypothetical protein
LELDAGASFDRGRVVNQTRYDFQIWDPDEIREEFARSTKTCKTFCREKGEPRRSRTPVRCSFEPT